MHDCCSATQSCMRHSRYMQLHAAILRLAAISLLLRASGGGFILQYGHHCLQCLPVGEMHSCTDNGKAWTTAVCPMRYALHVLACHTAR